jgi:hypothetical protein
MNAIAIVAETCIALRRVGTRRGAIQLDRFPSGHEVENSPKWGSW